MFALSALLATTSAHARVFFITDTVDTTNVTSLRGAVIAANHLGGNNTIFLQAGIKGKIITYPLTIPGADEDQAQTGDLDIIHGNLTIATFPDTSVIDASKLGDRAFQVFPHCQLTLANILITGARVYEELKDGGAINNAGTLILNASDITYCGTDLGGNGGAIKNSGNCLIKNAILFGNKCGDGAFPFDFAGPGGSGGAIYNTGNMILSKCAVVQNATGNGNNGKTLPEFYDFRSIFFYVGTDGANGGNGGGIYNTGQMQVNFSSIVANTTGFGGNGDEGGVQGGRGAVGGSGAGIFNANKLSVNTSTLGANKCGSGGAGGSAEGGPAGVGGDGGAGGGIYNAGQLDLASCTIAFNQTGTGGMSPVLSGLPGTGSGVINVDNAHATAKNTMIALNFATLNDNILSNDVAGSFLSLKFNLIGFAGTSLGFTNELNADLVGYRETPIDPLLDVVQITGRTVISYPLLPNGPAIDQGNSFSIHTDQRGQPRPHNFSAIHNAGDGSDIGAFELEK